MDYCELVKDITKYKELEETAIKRGEVQLLIDALTEQGTLEAYELCQNLLTDEYDFDWDEFAWSVAKSGDTRVLDHWYFEEVDILEYIGELLKTIHLPVIEWLFENFPKDIKSYHLTSETPLFFEYCVNNKLFLDVVVNQAYPALKGDRLANVLLKCMLFDYYPPLDIAVRSNSTVVETLLFYEPDQTDEMITEAFEVVNDEKIAQVLLDAFPQVEIYVDDLINAIHHRLSNILFKMDDPLQLDMIINMDNNYWDNYNSDMVWMLENLKDKLHLLELKLTPKLINAVAEEGNGELLKYLVNNFELVV